MNTATYLDKGNVHLDMKLEATLPYHEVIAGLVNKYSTTESRVLDVGCGLGHIASEIKKANAELRVDVADAYEACLEMTKSRGNINKLFKLDEVSFNLLDVVDQNYDVIVMSHVLEHLVFPSKALDELVSLLNPGGHLIVAVPNPVRPSVFLTNLFKYHYVNRGHVHAWDASHWKNFLEEIMGFEVVEYKTDFIQLPRCTKSKFLRSLGKLLVNAFPWWGFSNIAVIRNSSRRQSSVFERWKSRSTDSMIQPQSN